MALNRTLGLTMVTFYGTGMILGAGIYSIIGQAAGIAGDGLWLGFLCAALVALMTALSYAELATMYPKTGGEYIYLRNAFPNHPWIAGTIGNMMACAGCATAATVALAFSSYLETFIEVSRLQVALVLLVTLTAINIAGIKQSSWVNATFTLIEIGGLVLFVYIGWSSPTFGAALSVTPNWAVLSSAALVIFAYFGFENIVNLVEETKNPESTIPRAILLSIALSTVLYVLVSLSAVALMPSSQLAATESALTDAATKTSPRLAGVLGGIALFSTANTALIALVATSRIIYGISNDNSLPKILRREHSRLKTPWIAALVVFTVACAFLALGKVKTVASVSSIVTMTGFVAVNLAVISLRLRKPDLARPFRVPISIGKTPIVPVLGVLFSLLFLFQFEAKVYLIAGGAMLLSAGIHLMFARIGR